MLYNLTRKVLNVYLKEKRIISQGELTTEEIAYSKIKDALFVTLYHEGKVVASSGRIQCKKENTLEECMDLSLLCLKDPRFLTSLQDMDSIKIRIDRIGTTSRRILQHIHDLQVRNEGIIFLSQNLGVLSVILPNMVRDNPTPEKYFSLACKKAEVDEKKLTNKDYVIYGLSTVQESDF